MFPMVTTLDELRRARGVVRQARDSLAVRGVRPPDRVEVGMMVEVPAAALMAEVFALEIDFFSIGTNDLSQYTMAADRGNEHVAALADALEPAVLRLIARVIEAADSHGKWVGVCGELAGDPIATPVLIGLGVRELSINPKWLPNVRHVVSSITTEEAEHIVSHLATARTARDAEDFLRTYYVENLSDAFPADLLVAQQT